MHGDERSLTGLAARHRLIGLTMSPGDRTLFHREMHTKTQTSYFMDASR